jgi:ribosome assembly protein SQT1
LHENRKGEEKSPLSISSVLNSRHPIQTQQQSKMSNQPRDRDLGEDDDLLDADEAAEEIQEDGDHPMDEDDEEEEIQLQNDSAGYFDKHTDSIFCIAQHPTNPSIIVTGGGDDVAYVFDATVPEGPVLPSSYESNPQPQERQGLEPLQKLDGHKDSVNAVAFTLPNGEYVVTAGLDGQLRAYQGDKSGKQWKFVAEASEVPEINWVEACPNPAQPNVIALGANDGSVWVYQINAADTSSPLTIVQAFYLHTASSTAGAWTPDGKLLATLSEDGSLYVWDVFETGQAVVTQTAADQRFEVEGGLYSVACTSTMVAVGGAGGNIKVVGLPQAADQAKQNKAAKGSSATASSAGQILASLQAQSDGVETLSFSAAPLNLLAAGSVDGSIALFDTAHRFALRRHIKEAHEEFAVVKVAFVRNSQKGGWILTSAGMDGVLRRWDVRGGTTAAGQGFLKEWRGHRGEGEGGGVLGFVQGGGGQKVVTAGDDGVALVFKTPIA